MCGVLADGTIKLVLIFTIGGNLGPVDAVAMAVNPTEMTLGLEDKNSPLVDGETIDLDEVGIGDDMVFDAKVVGLGIGLGKIAIDEDLAGVEEVLQAMDQAGFGGGELYGIR